MTFDHLHVIPPGGLISQAQGLNSPVFVASGLFSKDLNPRVSQLLHVYSNYTLCEYCYLGVQQSLNGKFASLVFNSQFNESMTFPHIALKYPVFLPAHFLFLSCLFISFSSLLLQTRLWLTLPACFSSLIVLSCPISSLPLPVFSTHLLPYF